VKRECDEEVARKAAAQAGWRIPSTLIAAVAVAAARTNGAGQAAGRFDLHLPPEALLVEDVVESEYRAALVSPLAACEHRRLVEWADANNATVVLGPAVPWQEVPRSLDRALALLQLLQAGAGRDRARPSGGERSKRVHNVDEHMLTLLCVSDRALLDDYLTTLLIPLDELPDRRREMLEVTLLAWLDTGSYREAANRLHVHPKTVQYRVAQLRDLFGARLDCGHERSELHIALRLAELAHPERSAA